MNSRLPLLAAAIGLAFGARAWAQDSWHSRPAASAREAAARTSAGMTGALCGQDEEYDLATFAVTFPPDSRFAGQSFLARYGGCSVETETLGEPMEARASRVYSGEDTRWGLIVNTWRTSTTAYVSLVYRVGRAWRQAGSLGLVGVRDLPKSGAAFARAQVLDYADLGKPATTDVVIRPVR